MCSVEGAGILAGVVDPSSDRAVYKQIADVLRSAMVRGELGPGERLPSEHELVERYGVARGTARQAIVLLRSEGLIESVHGVGSFVRGREPAVVLRTDRPGRGWEIGREPENPLDESDQDGALSEDEGVRIETTGLVRVRLDADAIGDLLWVIKRLGVPASESLLMRRWCELEGGGRVRATFTSYVSWEAALRADLEHVPSGEPVYRALAAAGLSLDSYTEEVHARMPTEAEVREMRLGPGVPVMAVLRTCYLGDEIPLEVRVAVMSGERYRLLYEVRPHKRPSDG
jgi:GntR family transcriptional regulator